MVMLPGDRNCAKGTLNPIATISALISSQLSWPFAIDMMKEELKIKHKTNRVEKTFSMCSYHWLHRAFWKKHFLKASCS